MQNVPIMVWESVLAVKIFIPLFSAIHHICNAVAEKVLVNEWNSLWATMPGEVEADPTSWRHGPGLMFCIFMCETHTSTRNTLCDSAHGMHVWRHLKMSRIQSMLHFPVWLCFRFLWISSCLFPQWSTWSVSRTCYVIIAATIVTAVTLCDWECLCNWRQADMQSSKGKVKPQRRTAASGPNLSKAGNKVQRDFLLCMHSQSPLTTYYPSFYNSLKISTF